MPEGIAGIEQQGPAISHSLQQKIEGKGLLRPTEENQWAKEWQGVREDFPTLSSLFEQGMQPWKDAQGREHAASMDRLDAIVFSRHPQLLTNLELYRAIREGIINPAVGGAEALSKQLNDPQVPVEAFWLTVEQELEEGGISLVSEKKTVEEGEEETEKKISLEEAEVQIKEAKLQGKEEGRKEYEEEIRAVWEITKELMERQRGEIEDLQAEKSEMEERIEALSRELREKTAGVKGGGVADLAGALRSGDVNLAKLKEQASSDTRFVLHLLEGVRGSLSSEEWQALLERTRETFEDYQFIREGEEVVWQGQRFEISRRLGGGAFGGVYLAKDANDGEVVFKVTRQEKGEEAIWTEFSAMRDIVDVQKAAGISEDQLLTPDALGAGGKEENFASPFFFMEYVPGKGLDELCGEVARTQRVPLSEEEVKTIFQQALNLGQLLEQSPKGRMSRYSLSLATDFQGNRIKVYDEEQMRIKVVDWSIPGISPKEEREQGSEAVRKDTEKAVNTMGGFINRLLGGSSQSLAPEISEQSKKIIAGCQTGEYKTFKELYEAVAGWETTP